MNTKRAMGMVLMLVAMLACQSAQAFYHPHTGRWLSRDPIDEKGGVNLYLFVRNESLSRWDLNGLLDFVFKQTVNQGGQVSSLLANIGAFGQPGANASGSMEVEATGFSAMSAVTIKASPGHVVNCNTVLGPAGDQDAGRLRLYVQNADPGTYQIYISLNASAKVVPKGLGSVPKATVAIDAGGQRYIRGIAAGKRTSFQDSKYVVLSVVVPSKNAQVLVADFRPTVGVTAPCCSGEATATGEFRVNYYLDPSGNTILP